VRVQQPFETLQQQGWDLRIHEPPLDLNKAIRQGSLVIWQRPVPKSWNQWRHIVAMVRQRDSLLLLEWDDHPELFPAEVRQRLQACDHAQLRMAHALHCSCPRLARALQTFHPHTLVVENGVDPIPLLDLQKHRQATPLRVFLGNLNRLEEHQRLLPGLRRWLRRDPNLQLVCAGPTGLEGALPMDRVEQHPLLAYATYRRLLRSCHLALLPLLRGEAQACKTPIKWLEASAESTAVVAGPELYGTWLDQNRHGLWAESPEQMLELAQELAADPALRQRLVRSAHKAAAHHNLHLQLIWRQELYRHLWRLRTALDQQLLARWPELNGL
jgi:glycosyltransferase involved in cell wall biosynthesis